MGAGAADWKLSPKAILKGDFEYQHKVGALGLRLSAAGGHDPCPTSARFYPSTMLGEQAVGQAEHLRRVSTPARASTTICPVGGRAFAAGELTATR
jgi:hypothetical protein